MHMTGFYLKLIIGSVCTVHVVPLFCSIKCSHLNIYVFPHCAVVWWELFKKRNPALFEKHSLPCRSQTRIVSIALDNIISHHLWGEVPANSMGKPCEGVGERVGDLMETASSKFRGSAVSSGVISTFSNSLSFPSLTITAETLHVFHRLTGNIQQGPAK